MIYQFYWCSVWRGKNTEKNEFQNVDEYYTLEGVLSLLKVSNQEGNLNRVDLFKTVGQLKVQVMVGNFAKGIDKIMNIGEDLMKDLSKSFSGYINFFYYLGFGYLMTGAYKECLNIFEGLLLFTNKYK